MVFDYAIEIHTLEKKLNPHLLHHYRQLLLPTLLHTALRYYPALLATVLPLAPRKRQSPRIDSQKVNPLVFCYSLPYTNPKFLSSLRRVLDLLLQWRCSLLVCCLCSVSCVAAEAGRVGRDAFSDSAAAIAPYASTSVPDPLEPIDRISADRWNSPFRQPNPPRP
jgi:hypothetical protein